jgi:hypothetical protein
LKVVNTAIKKNLKSIYKYLVYSIVLLPALVYFGYWWYYGQNLPHWDDYAILKFVDSFWFGSPTWAEKLQLIFSQHNEHRIVYTRLVALASMLLLGHVNFKFIMLAGSISLFIILFVFHQFFKKWDIAPIYLLPISLVLFQLGHWENSFWGMAAVQNFSVVAFCTVAIYQLSENKIPWFWLPLAAFTSGNASVLLPIIGSLLLIMQGQRRQMYKFAGLSAFVLLAYFVFYIKPPDSQAINASKPWQNVQAGLVGLGSNIDVNPYLPLDHRLQYSQYLGITLLLVLLVSLYYIWKQNVLLADKRQQQFYFLLGIVLFCLGTCAMATLSRMQYGLYVFLVSRYKIYGSVAIAASVAALFLVLGSGFRKVLAVGIVMVFLVFYVQMAYYTVPQIHHYQNTETAQYYTATHQNFRKNTNTWKCIDTNLVINEFVVNENIMTALPQLKVVETNDHIIVKGTNMALLPAGVGQGAYLEFLSPSQRLVFATVAPMRQNKKTFLLTGLPQLSAGFTAQIPREEVPAGQYFINVLQPAQTNFDRLYTNYYLETTGKLAKYTPQNW